MEKNGGENTFIIFTSDHGEMAMSHRGISRYYDDKGTNVMMPLRQKGAVVYEENNNVPLIIASKDPGLVPSPGTTVRTLSSHIETGNDPLFL